LLENANKPPLFYEQLVRQLVTEEIFLKKGDEWLLKPPVDEEWLSKSIIGIVQSRIGRLEESTRRVLQTAAVIGRSFALSLLEFMGTADEKLREKAATLEGMGFVQRDRERGGLHYFFQHAITQEVVYNSLMQEHKRTLHARVLQALCSMYGEDSEPHYEINAYHAFHANLPQEALKFMERSADRARRQYANREALEYYGQIITLLLSSPSIAHEPRTRKLAETLLQQSEVNRYVGEIEEAKHDLRQALETAGRLHDNCLSARIHVGNSLLLAQTGDYDQAKKESNAAKECLDSLDSPELEMKLACVDGIIAWKQTDFPGAESAFKQVIELSELTEQKNFASNAYNNLGLLYGNKGLWLQALQAHTRALEIRKEAEDLWGQAASYNNIGIVLENHGDYEAAELNYLEALELSQRTGFREVETASLANLGELAETRGRLYEAMEYNARSLESARQVNDLRSQAIALDNLGNVHLVRGETTSAEKRYIESIQLAESIGDKDACSRSLLGLCSTRTAQKRLKEASSCMDKARQIVEETKLEEARPRLLRVDAELLAAKDEFDEAFEKAGLALETATQAGQEKEANLAKELIKDIEGRGRK